VCETLDHIAKLPARKPGDQEPGGLLGEFVAHPQGVAFIQQATQWRKGQAESAARREASKAFLTRASTVEDLFVNLDHPEPPEHAEEAGPEMAKHFQTYWTKWSEPLEQPCGPRDTPTRAALFEMLRWAAPSDTGAQPSDIGAQSPDTGLEEGPLAAKAALGAACGAIVEFAAHLVVGFVAGPHSERCVDALRAGHTLLSDLVTKSGSFPEPPVQLTLDWMRSLCAVAAGLQKYNRDKYTTANADAFELVRAYLAAPALQQPRGSQNFVTARVRVGHCQCVVA
jgi:hypothetical protein